MARTPIRTFDQFVHPEIEQTLVRIVPNCSIGLSLAYNSKCPYVEVYYASMHYSRLPNAPTYICHECREKRRLFDYCVQHIQYRERIYYKSLGIVNVLCDICWRVCMVYMNTEMFYSRCWEETPNSPNHIAFRFKSKM
ncbi:ORF059 [Spodoptera frugiperda granulovirus]|uniref:ORF059 n=1 Tax=Spodoptera frugiperda granulovirus TaxID=307454 RepID=A0A0C5B331_9BBAC|nr:ORF059 [Spodoptera frugiperda granulovirus]AJK91720.1 ORF059 [Spodoptera frugiperda granulovirus]